MKIIRLALMLLTIVFLNACGHGGNSGSIQEPAMKTATIKLSTSGIPSTSLSGVGITITLADGVSPALNSDGSVAPGVVVVSGVALPGASLTPVYTPAAGLAKGKLAVTVATANLAGFGSGEFATVTLTVAAGLVPVPGAFTLSYFNPVDIIGNAATGLTPGFSLTIL